MSSLKSLMKQKKQSARLNHPHAKYSNSGQLSCTLCNSTIKNEQIWGSHLVSKQHRVNVQRIEQEKQLAEQQQSTTTANGKRRSRSPSSSSSSSESTSKRPRPSSTSDENPSNLLPSDFFADPSLAPQPSTSATTLDPSTEEEEEDPEIDSFLSSLSAPNPASTSSTATATISAQPIKFEFGAPKVREEKEEELEDHEEGGETEEERLEREMREEREEMMARLEEEEREQREADEKVTALKRRLDLMRAQKKGKKA